MGFNFGRARRQFERTQAKLKKEYEAAGMDEEQMTAMYELDLHLFNRDVAYFTHNQSLEVCLDDDSDTDNCPFRKNYLEGFSVYQQPSMATRFWWLDEIENPAVYEKLSSLSHGELMLIDNLAFRGLSQNEIAIRYNLTQSGISRQIIAIRNKLGEEFLWILAGRNDSGSAWIGGEAEC